MHNQFTNQTYTSPCDIQIVSMRCHIHIYDDIGLIDPFDLDESLCHAGFVLRLVNMNILYLLMELPCNLKFDPSIQ
jgi:hypothetical protein